MLEIVSYQGNNLPAEAPEHQLADERIQLWPDRSLVVVDGIVRPDIRGHKLGMLTLVASRVDRTVTKTELCEEVWGVYDDATRVRARVHMHRLRAALGAEDLGHPADGAIESVGDIGYRGKSTLGEEQKLPDAPMYFLGDKRLAVAADGFSAYLEGRIMPDLTETEYVVLREMAMSPGSTVTYSDFQEALWGYPGDAARDTIRRHIFSLRAQMGVELGHVSHGVISTDYGVGYRGEPTLPNLTFPQP